MNLRISHVIGATACSLALSAGALAQTGGTVPHQFVVRLSPFMDIDQVAHEHEATVVASYLPHRLYLLQTNETDDDTQHGFDCDSRIEFYEHQQMVTMQTGTTQSFFVSVAPEMYPEQPATDLVGAPQATQAAQGSGVIVAILDTGISPHAAFSGTLLSGFNFIASNADTIDTADGLDNNNNGVIDEMTGHGTMMAGLVQLIAPMSQLLPVKVLDSDGVGTSFTVAAGIYYAADNHAKVLNLSLSSNIPSSTISDAINFARISGCVVVAAAGNGDSFMPSFPAAYPGVIGVAATDNSDERAPFTNYGPYLALSAPGVNLVSTSPGDHYSAASGTSFSAALVSGAATLLASSGVTTPSDIRQRLTSTAMNIDALNPGYSNLIGRGRLQIAKALGLPQCGSADFNGDSDSGTDADIEAFFACMAGACCPTCESTDINGDGDFSTDADIEAFFRILGGGSC